jgi:murein tripeptide amidase MpaA
MYRTVGQLDTLTGLLAQYVPDLVTRFQLPEPSVEGRPVFALRLRSGDGGQRRGILLVGGTHARELMNPDLLVELAVDMVVSYITGDDLVLGNRTWPATELRLMLDALDVYLVPCSNPDGRIHAMTVDSLWRKNRRDNPGTPCDGVDLNRNCDALWGVTQGQTSCAPCSDVYAGPSAFSEPETRNVRHLLDTYRIDCFADVHSYSELVLYPWGHAPTQTSDPSRNLTTLPSGTCQPIGVPGYEEYMPPRDLERFVTVAQRMVDAIADVRGRAYTPQSGIELYATTGTHGDYVYGRHIADPSLQKTYGYTFETGPSVGDARESFHPADPTLIKRDAKSGMIALAQQCVCAIELIGTQLLGREQEVNSLRRVRDDLLGTTDAGRQWIALFERAQGQLIGLALGDERLARDAAALLERAARALDDDQATVTKNDVERARSLLGELSKGADSDDVRRDLNAAIAAITQMAGRTSREAVETLMTQPPNPKERPSAG